MDDINVIKVDVKYSYDGSTVVVPPVSSGSIVATAVLTGPKGEKGDKGDKGDKGEKGDPGTTDYNELINKPDLTAKVDKVTTVNTLYGVNGSGNQASYPISQASATSSIAQRSSGGTLAVGTPTSAAHATTKAYVDTQDTSVASVAQSNLTAHTSDTANPHNVTKSQVGLSDVPNLDTTAAVANQHTHANKAVLDATTASFTTADESRLDGIEAGAQVNTVTSVAGKTGAVTLAKGDVGLGNVSNLAPADMPVSTATQTALNGKVDTTGDQTIAGTKTFSSAPIAPSGTSIGGVLHLTGSGFPNGVVSASVGSIYIDTAVTNGASSWIKKSGTGNTGWEVSVGDTGWRDVTPATHLLGEKGYVRARRIGVQVELHVRIGTDKSFSGSSTGIVIPLGFRKPSNIFASSPARRTNNTLWDLGATAYFQTANRDGILYCAGSITSEFIFLFNYLTTEGWPSILPGTAV